MRYVLTTAAGRMEVREGPAPEPAAGEAVVAVEAVGLCGSDYHLYDGTHPYAQFPQIQGHEVVGVVEHDPTGTVARGLRVAVDPVRPCGRCFPCRRGRYNCCANLAVMGAHTPGGLAERIAVPAERLHPTGPVPPQIAVLTEPVSIGLQCVHRAGVAAGDRVVVLGAGPIGLAAALGAHDRRARVLVTDREPTRLAHARRLGAERVVVTGPGLDAEVAEFTGGDGPAVVVEATGVPALVRRAVDLVAPSGTVVVVGISTAETAIPVVEFSRKELNLIGSRNSTGLLGAAATLVARHAVALAGIVTDVFPLTEVPAAIEYARASPDRVTKVVIDVAG